MQPARKLATYQDLLDAPQGAPAQLIAGDLVLSPRPSMAHQTVTSVLGMDLGSPFDRGHGGGPGGWWIRDEPELHLGGDVLVPDLAGWRRARVGQLPATSFVSIAPDWVCEVLSESTASTDRVRKMPIYRREGVTHVWLIDPGRRTLEVFRADGDRWTLVNAHADDERVRVEPFEAIELELSALWHAQGV